ncbi:ATP-binding cassette sub-family A member 17-like [Phymastichus coffea]|uniref:ATP-binding cassette sub-family A member 17-like n=1 Tax=Phymastichus coffea TaxID=108790 RepID=UPI00273BF42E|nr:ATP-binding cassette sub-family A member 17-like [Phymastichus coffea]
MILHQFRMFKALLYKNLLVRKRHWKLGLFVEILVPMLTFIAVWGVKSASLNNKAISQEILTPLERGDTKFRVKTAADYFEYSADDYLLIAPDNRFTQRLKSHLQICYPGLVMMYRTESDMISDYFAKKSTKFSRFKTTLALIFDDDNVNGSTQNFKYRIRISDDVSALVYSETEATDVFETSFTGLQLCVDSALIKMKKNDPNFSLDIFAQRMPIPAKKDTNEFVKYMSIIVCGLAVSAFLIPLCVETSHTSSEKFLGVNVLMSMNGVPNYLNLLSWLTTGIIFSLLYIVPVVFILCYAATEQSTRFFEYANSFIVFLVLTLNVAHLIAFGMHVSAYFTRSLFMVTGLIVIYIGSIVFVIKGVNVDSYKTLPYLGIIFPNMLLFRAFEEMNFYEDISKGIHFNNLFQVTNRAYGLGGSVGFMLIFSIVGIILHLLLANYIYAINPGKYGVKKGPLYFLQIFKRLRKTRDYDKVENMEFNNTRGNSFEPVTASAYSPGIRIRNLKKLYKTSLFGKAGVYALQSISVDFYKGQITALLGHNGAGKTTMMSILSGMISSSEGLVLIDGKDVNEHIDEIMSGMGLCPQENMLFPQLSVAEQVKFFAMLKSKSKSLTAINSEVIQLLNQLQLLGKRNALPNQLSGGQKRRACLAMALIGDSSTLILDEPTSGLDPESKRDIWNILLKMRGRKTILISTHDMEEADVLGDRIAIMHSGQLKCYGTPLYLKKLLGRGNIEVTLSTEPWCDPENVRSKLETPCEVLSDDRGKMVLSIPYNNNLPDTLDTIEEKKKELGITGMSVSIITLEKVFPKVTQDNNDPSESRRPFTNTSQKLQGLHQVLHIWKALLCKKAIYTLKNISTTVIMLFLFSATLASTILILKDKKSREKEVAIKLDMYHDANSYYKIHQYGKPYAHAYAHLIRDLGGQSQEMSSSSDFNEELLEIAHTDYNKYNFRVLMAASFQSNEDHSRVNCTAHYNSALARFAEPMSINLVSNAVLRNVTNSNHSIEITAQALPKDNDRSDTNSDSILLTATAYGYVIAGLFACLIYPAVALFVVHPIRESLTNVKHLQRMTGASCFSYWGTMLIFDLTVFFVITLLFVLGLVAGDCIVDLRMFAWKQVVIQLGLFALLAINTLLLAYVFSFWKKSTSTVIKLLSLVPLVLVLVDLVMSLLHRFFDRITDKLKEESEFFFYRRIQKAIFLFIPYISFFEGQVVFFNITWINAVCAKVADYVDFKTECLTGGESYQLKICCDMVCNEDTCGEAVPYFLGFYEDISLNISFLALCISPVLYLGILLILEYRLLGRLFARIRGGIPDNSDDGFEEQVKKIKHEIAYEVCKAKIAGMSNGTATEKFKVIPERRNDTSLQNEDETKDYVFFVYELRKIYGSCLGALVVAVQDLSFGVSESQCFGLLGVNGAGKSTTFKMMTGEEVPNHGLVHLRDQNAQGDGNCLRQIGYCPQNHAIISSLNAYDHLRLFGRLRGIPDDQLEQEVQDWIDRLCLNPCALQPSGTYSGGNKRRLNIAMALIGIPSLVLLDEPTTGVDPAARRSLWNTVQSMKGRKTILISTHDMEEADVLGDRIAIMHMGQLKSYGTPMFLKKFMGGGNIEVTLSTEPRCNTTKVCTFLDEGSQVIADELGKIVLNVPNNNRLPDSLDKLKENKEELGITGMSISVITLEKVFLKVIEDNTDASKTHQSFSLTTEKLNSDKQFWQTWRGLISKKATYSLKNISTIISVLVLLVLAELLTIFTLMDHTSSATEKIQLRRDMYHNVENFYKIHLNSKAYGESYKNLVKESNAALIEYQSRDNLTEVLLNIGAHDLFDYYYRHVVGAEFASKNNLVNAVALYNSKFAQFAQPLSINLVSNAILKTMMNDNYSIEISVQETPEMDEFAVTPNEVKAMSAYMVSIMFVCFLYPAVAFFVVHPIRETLTDIKHLQRMAGVSCFSYWGTMFLFDFLLLFYVIVCMIVGLVIADWALDMKMFGPTEALILLGLLTLFAVNVLPLIYIFSFWGQSTTTAMKLLTLVPLGLVLIEIVMSVVEEYFEEYRHTSTVRTLQKGIFLLTPYISFLHGQISFYNSLRINQECKRLYQHNKYQLCLSAPCCDLRCNNNTCENAILYFREFSEEISLSTSYLFLCLTPILYFAILGALEYKLIEKLIARMHSGIPDNIDSTFEEQVKNVKREIAYEVSKLGIEGVDTGKYQSTAGNGTEEAEENGNNCSNHVFLVYELRKLYGKFVAVQDISFGVNESECFGLLGVNGAGKSTTFKMMTGEIIPNHGIMHLRDKSARNNRNENYLKNLGYCPQNDAIIRSLNSYDHLRLFARIRGIPENKVEEEVQNWIDRLNLNVCALQPSGTYSGGNKRRLNIAMALIGIPSLVLLDEPTTGVDPAARRSLWNTIQTCQATGQAVILTSHSMEECEALCNRLAIMVDGKFVCIGSSTELKQRFSAGYDVQIQMDPEKSRNEIDGIKQDLIGALPCEVVDENSGYMKCHVLSANITWRQMHNVMIGLKNNYTCILDYSVLSSTLEQLFLIFAKAANKTNRKTN